MSDRLIRSQAWTRPGIRRPRLWTLGWIVGLSLLAAPVLAEREAIPFAAVEVFIEINDTDGDAGLQIFLDAEGWRQVTVLDSNGRRIADFRGKGGVAQQGITELALESAEPSFEEQPLEEFLERFPAGFYSFLGRTVEGDELYGVAELTHDLPDGPVIVSPEEGEEIDPGGFSVMWNEVVTPEGIQISGYQVIVEREDPLRVLRVDLPGTATAVSVPAEFLEAETEYSVEVIAQEVSGNKTISQVEFETGP
jgi:hypothetical protein